MMLGAAVTWAIGIVVMKRYPVALPTTALTGWMMVIGGIPIVIGALLFGGIDFKPLSVKATIALVYVVVVAMVFCHWAFMRLVTMLPDDHRYQQPDGARRRRIQWNADAGRATGGGGVGRAGPDPCRAGGDPDPVASDAEGRSGARLDLSGGAHAAGHPDLVKSDRELAGN